MVRTVNVAIGSVILAILAIVALILLAYALYVFALVGSYASSVSVNPYCIRQLCTSDGTQKPAYEVAPVDDPTRGVNQTLTYCILNAPPCELISAMNTCAGFTDPSSTEGESLTPLITNQDLTDILEFYNQEYYPRCHYSQSFTGTVTESSDVTSAESVNTPNFVNGPNDDFLQALLACSKKRGLDTDPNWVALNTACGTVCQGSS